MTAVSFDRDCGFCIGCVDHFEKIIVPIQVVQRGETDAGLYVLADFKGGLEIRVSGQEESKMVQ